MRARWYLYPEVEPGDDGGQPHQTGNLMLELQKSNLGRADQQMVFSWDKAAHLLIGRRLEAQSRTERSIIARTEQDGIKAAFRACAAAGVYVPAAMTGPRTAYNVLAARPEMPETLKAKTGGKARFRRHIEEMRSMGTVIESSIRRDNRHSVISLTLSDIAIASIASIVE